MTFPLRSALFFFLFMLATPALETLARDEDGAWSWRVVNTDPSSSATTGSAGPPAMKCDRLNQVYSLFSESSRLVFIADAAFASIPSSRLQVAGSDGSPQTGPEPGFYVSVELSELSVVNPYIDDRKPVGGKKWAAKDLQWTIKCEELRLVSATGSELPTEGRGAREEIGRVGRDDQPVEERQSPSTGPSPPPSLTTGGSAPSGPPAAYRISFLSVGSNASGAPSGTFAVVYTMWVEESEPVLRPGFEPSLPAGSFDVSMYVTGWDMPPASREVVRVKGAVITSATFMSVSAENWPGEGSYSSSIKKLFAKYIQLYLSNAIAVQEAGGGALKWMPAEDLHTTVDNPTASPLRGDLTLVYPMGIDQDSVVAFRGALQFATGSTALEIIAIVVGVLVGLCCCAAIGAVVFFVYRRHPELSRPTPGADGGDPLGWGQRSGGWGQLPEDHASSEDSGDAHENSSSDIIDATT